jgi:hypothetical protein
MKDRRQVTSRQGKVPNVDGLEIIGQPAGLGVVLGTYIQPDPTRDKHDADRRPSTL